MDMKRYMLISTCISTKVGRRKNSRSYWERSEGVKLGRSRYEKHK